MPAGGAQRVIVVDNAAGDQEVTYTLAPGEYLEFRTATFKIHPEPFSYVTAQVRLSDPAAGDLAVIATPPWPIFDFGNHFGGVAITFGLGVDSVTTEPPLIAMASLPVDVPTAYNFHAPLPETPLADGQSITVSAFGYDSDGHLLDVGMQEIVLVAVDLTETTETGVIPPYTALPFAEQVSPVGAAA